MSTKTNFDKKATINYCPRDYKNRHYWESVGVERGMIVYQCSQCRLCAFEEIKMIGNLFPDKEVRKA